MVNELVKHGAEVVHERQDNVHVSGHACQQELKIIISLASLSTSFRFTASAGTCTATGSWPSRLVWTPKISL